MTIGRGGNRPTETASVSERVEMAKHVNHIVGKIAPLASVTGQERYLVGGTRESHWLVEELWNDAWDVVEAVTQRRGWGADVDGTQRAAVEQLQETLSVVEESVFSDLETIDPAQLVRNHAGWRQARAAAVACMQAMGVEISVWERKFLND